MRYADEFVMGSQYEDDAHAILAALRERLDLPGAKPNGLELPDHVPVPGQVIGSRCESPPQKSSIDQSVISQASSIDHYEETLFLWYLTVFASGRLAKSAQVQRDLVVTDG